MYPSQCNFILVEFLESFKFSAKEAYHLLSSKGIIVREMEEYNLPNCLRITIGKEEANLLLIETVNAFNIGIYPNKLEEASRGSTATIAS